jgi:hypothetical protein
MRCYICNRILKEPTFNRDHIDWDPCPTCLQVVQDTLASFYDRPSADEDELQAEPDPFWDSITTWDAYEGILAARH